jgi:hypothetical protein
MTSTSEHKPKRYPKTDLSTVKNPLGEGNYIKTAGCLIIG